MYLTVKIWMKTIFDHSFKIPVKVQYLPTVHLFPHLLPVAIKTFSCAVLMQNLKSFRLIWGKFELNLKD